MEEDEMAKEPKMVTCKHCGAEIAASAKTCPKCGGKNKKPFYKNPLLIALVVIVIIIAAATSGGDKKGTDGNKPSETAAVKTDERFAGDCGASVTAEMGSSIIGYPTLKVYVSNTSDKEIAAVKFYFVPIDVYGDEITKWTSQNYLYSDTAIPAGSSDSLEYQFIEDSVKKGELYLYSVYFSDGTEWGNKDAARSTIKDSGLQITVEGVS